MRQITQRDHTELMHFLFKQVQDPNDWKGPIDAVVPWDCANVYMQAVEFMTAVRPTCERIPGMPGVARLTCVGYRAGPAGG